MDKRRDMAEFFLVHLKQEDAVKYWCQYDTVAPWGTSNKSDPVQLVVTGEGTGESRWPWAVPARRCPIAVSSVNSDPSYAPPAISLNPEECVDVGMNVTIQCWSQEHGGTIFLHKDGHSAPIQQQDPDDGGSATFTLFGVNTADSGTYRCSYRVGGSYLLSSPLGDNVTLEVIPRPAPPGATSRSPEAVQFQVSVWVRGPLISTCPMTPPPDLTRKPQTLPVGTPRNPLPFMPSHDFVCIPKSSPWGPPNLHHGDAPQPKPKPPRMLQALNIPRLNGHPQMIMGPPNITHREPQCHSHSFPKTTPPHNPNPLLLDSPPPIIQCHHPLRHVSPGDSEGLIYAQLQAVTPSTHPPGTSTTPEPPIIYAEVGTRGPR
ncbi:leucine-rich repeat extensin-like protein 3 [Gallus gallus]|uniref:leucine-rich repeat extensin-like protein 3 n=1 Tax=Gallus gallus TaxID=9031 RepID=UPI001AE49FDA|nr:leucine-rich repeat extensin-like protein 3 [Gallus gallus]